MGVEDNQQIDVGDMNPIHHSDTNNELDLSQQSLHGSVR
jgi:hypothetical protein